jgi:hypothetical protein
MNVVFILVVVVVLILLSIKPSSFTSSSSVVEYVYELYETRFKPRFSMNNLSGKLDSVDMVYAITMPQRKHYITEQINKLGLQCKFLDAVQPKDFSESEKTMLSDINTPGTYMYKHNTRLAVLFSFIMCYTDSIKNGYSTIIVFEDDIITKVSIDMLNKGTAEFAKCNYDVFFMGYCELNCKQPYVDNYTFIRGLTDPSILCGHAVCLKTNILPELIKYSFPMTMPSDEIFTKYFKENRIKACIPKTVYFDQVDRNTMKSLNESTSVLKYCRN